VGRCISLSLLVLSVVYFGTRVANYFELKDARTAAMQSFNLSEQKLQLKFENIAMLHIVTIVHSITCIIISGVVAKTMRSQSYIDRRQYFLVLGMTASVSVIYFFALIYVGYKGTLGHTDDYEVLIILESVLDVIGSLSNDTVSFLFALLMNFLILVGLFSLNLCSAYLVEIAKAIEQRRTGGRNKNELELNSFSVGGREDHQV
jgi:uncharacterized membrane protein